MARLPSATPALRPASPRLSAPEKTADPFYLSAAWRNLVHLVKVQRGYVCEQCSADMSSNRRALIGDHIVERKDGGPDLDPLNIRLLCLPCHNRKTAKARMHRARRG